MKYTFIILGTILFQFYSCQPAANRNVPNAAEVEFNEAAETEAIMKVIENETKCFFDGNYECWASHWSHTPYAMQAWNNSDGSSSAAIGWEKINAQGKDWIEKYYKNGENIIHPVVKREKPLVKYFNNSTAWLTWKQYNADQEKKLFSISQETRIVEKGEGGWKIVNVSAFWGTEAKIPIDSLHLN